MKLQVIKTEADYNEALIRLEAIFDSKPGTAEGDELELLSLLIENYESKHFQIKEELDPVEAIKFRLDQLGHSQADLAKILGHKSRASEVLSKKRKLTLPMIRKIHASLNIPPSVLIQAY